MQTNKVGLRSAEVHINNEQFIIEAYILKELKENIPERLYNFQSNHFIQ